MKNVGEKRMDKNKKDGAIGNTILYQVIDENDGCGVCTYVSTYDKQIALQVLRNVQQAKEKFQRVRLAMIKVDESIPELTWLFFESNDVECELSSVCVEEAGSDFETEWNTDPGRCWKIQAKTRKEAERKLKKEYGIVLTTPKEA